MDYILTPVDPERQRALPEAPTACPQCGACAWRRNGTYARDLVVLGRLQVQRWQCKACLGSASPLPPGVTSRQRPQAFRELVTSLYVHSVSFRGLVRILDLLGCGVGAATLWRDVQAVAPGRMPDPQAALPSRVEVDETWLSIGGEKRPAAVVLGPKGERLDPEVCQLLWHLVARWHDLVRSQHNLKVPASTNRLEGWLGRFKPRARLTRGLKTEAGTRHFVGLMARGMA